MIALTQIHQIEMTSRCNLACKYCVHPTMKRAKVDMTFDVFDRTLHWAKHFQGQGTQGSLNLAGIGESTIHKKAVEFMKHARKVMGPQQQFVLATNGVEVAQHPEMAQEMAEALGGWEGTSDMRYRTHIYVSLHRPEKGGPAVEALKKVGVLAGISIDAAVHATDWAGQIKWHVSAQRAPCPWVKGGWAFVLSDGSISRCSFDGTGIGIIGHVYDDVSTMKTSPYVLCKSCHQDVGVPMQEETVAVA